MHSAKSWREREEQLRRSSLSTRAWSIEELSPYYECITDTMSRLTGLMADLFANSDPTGATSREKALPALSAWTTGRLVNAYGSALNGYLVDATMLARSAFEGLLLLIAFDIEDETRPTDSLLSARWAAEEFVGQKQVRKLLTNQVSPRLASLSGLYSRLSDLSHPGHIKAVLLQAHYTPTSEGGSFKFGLGGIRKPHDLRIVVHFIWYESLVLLGYLPLAFPSLEHASGTRAFVDGALVKCDELLATVQGRGKP